MESFAHFIPNKCKFGKTLTATLYMISESAKFGELRRVFSFRTDTG